MKLIRLKSIVPLLDERDCLDMFQYSYDRYPQKKKGVLISLEDARLSFTDNFDDYILAGSMYVMCDQRLTDVGLDIEISQMREAFVLAYYRRFKHVLNPYFLRHKIVKRDGTTIFCEYVITLKTQNTSFRKC
ncbi:TPA: hypothetical protein ACGO4G_002030 [Streptococcus suis]